ncbi:hypothetical protein [Sphingomonas solaris]|uniref:Uncharacterized protein n=1 Tax=Alterirhizorhabdus solaris TaxID=2529389 RepID=A0A558QSZ2_9SPHN|nr:hypothetical protein [Sphingomonas solaris]TVV70260.1 hypothetical protein FOY91_19560 [Sphingomonas solaris]
MAVNQLALYALVLVLGWLLGLLSRSGGGAWRRKYETERSARIALENTQGERDNVARTRIAELERRAAAAEAASSVGNSPVAGVGTAMGAGAATGAGNMGTLGATTPADRDDLSLIHGIGRSGESRLNEAGLHRFVDISRLSDTETASLENHLGAEPGTVAREEWREQAALLASGRADEHRNRFG